MKSLREAKPSAEMKIIVQELVGIYDTATGCVLLREYKQRCSRRPSPRWSSTKRVPNAAVPTRGHGAAEPDRTVIDFVLRLRAWKRVLETSVPVSVAEAMQRASLVEEPAVGVQEKDDNKTDTPLTKAEKSRHRTVHRTVGKFDKHFRNQKNTRRQNSQQAATSGRNHATRG